MKYTPKTKDELKALVMDKSINLGDIDVSNITDMSYLFTTINMHSLQSQYLIPINRTDFSGIEKWDVSNVTDMSYMFYYCKNFNQDLSSWDVSNVTNMRNMFSGCEFNQPLDNWNVSNVKDMRYMFSSYKNFNQDLRNWDVSNVEDMSGMFNNAKMNEEKAFGYGFPNYIKEALRYDDTITIKPEFFRSILIYDKALLKEILDARENTPNIIIDGNLSLAHSGISYIPNNVEVKGYIDIRDSKITDLSNVENLKAEAICIDNSQMNIKIHESANVDCLSYVDNNGDWVDIEPSTQVKNKVKNENSNIDKDKDIKTFLENMSQDDLQKVKDLLETLLENKSETTIKNKQR